MNWRTLLLARKVRPSRDCPHSELAIRLVNQSLENHFDSRSAEILHLPIETSPEDLQKHLSLDESKLDQLMKLLPDTKAVRVLLEGLNALYREIMSSEYASLAGLCSRFHHLMKTKEVILTTYDGPQSNDGSLLSIEELAYQRDSHTSEIKTHKRISTASLLRTYLFAAAAGTVSAGEMMLFVVTGQYFFGAGEDEISKIVSYALAVMMFGLLELLCSPGLARLYARGRYKGLATPFSWRLLLTFGIECLFLALHAYVSRAIGDTRQGVVEEKAVGSFLFLSTAGILALSLILHLAIERILFHLREYRAERAKIIPLLEKLANFRSAISRITKQEKRTKRLVKQIEALRLRFESAKMRAYARMMQHYAFHRQIALTALAMVVPAAFDAPGISGNPSSSIPIPNSGIPASKNGSVPALASNNGSTHKGVSKMSHFFRALFLGTCLLAILTGCAKHDQLSPSQFKGANIEELVDNTDTVKTAPSALAASNELITRTSVLLQKAHTPINIEIRSSSKVGEGEPPVRYSPSLNGNLIGRQKKEAINNVASECSNWIKKIHSEPSISGETRLIEDIYMLSKHSGQMTGAKDTYREILVLTDLGQCSKLLKADKVQNLDAMARQTLVSTLLKQYPPITLAPHKATFIYVLSVDYFEHTTPAQIENLKSFWELLLKSWGIVEIEFVEPKAQNENTVKANVKADSSPFVETVGSQPSPTLKVSNNMQTDDQLRLKAEAGGKEYLLSLPHGQTHSVTLEQAGIYQYSLGTSDGKWVYAKGRGKFAAYKNYTTNYCPGAKDSQPLTFGDTP